MVARQLATRVVAVGGYSRNSIGVGVVVVAVAVDAVVGEVVGLLLTASRR